MIENMSQLIIKIHIGQWYFVRMVGLDSLDLLLHWLLLFCVIQKEYDVNRKYYASAIVAFAYLMVTTLESTSFANPSVIILAVIFGIILKEQKGNQRI